MSTYDEVLEKGVYFVLKNDADLFAHLSICLAEGLDALGIPVFSSRDYWLTDLENQSYLFKHNRDVAPDDCAVCVVDISGQPLETAQAMLRPVLNSKAIKVVVNNSDFNILPPEFDQIEYIFQTHMIRCVTYPKSFIPWGFGISDRMRVATTTDRTFAERKREVLVNFRRSFNQGVRISMEFSLLPQLERLFPINRVTDYEPKPEFIEANSFHHLHWMQLQGRHNPYYYDRLKTTMVCCSYGGNFVYLEHRPSIVRWDSWRFWESLAAGCVTIHLDLDKYGFMLPVMPENWHHYIGVNLENPKEVVERLHDQPEIMAEIAEQGRQWALEHYSPTATASYFLDVICGEELGTTLMLAKFLGGL